MYASLKDAYRVPSFETQARRRRADGMSAVQETAQQIEAFTNLDTTLKQMGGQPSSSGTGFGNAYTGKLNDYKYACKQYGVCPAASMEGFEGGPARAVGTGPNATGAGAPMMNDGRLGKMVTKCDPLQAPAYQYPMSAADKAKFDKAMEVSMGNATIETYMGDEDDMDDLDAYLRVSDSTSTAVPVAAPTPKAPAAAPKDPEAAPAPAAPPATPAFVPNTTAPQAPGAPLVPLTTTALAPPPPAAAPAATSWMDLLLFFSVGVVLIFLMEQIFKVAMMSGMRETVDMMAPILKMIETAKAA